MAADPEQTKGETPSPLPTESTSTLTREGSLTPQWLQPKNNAATMGGTNVPGAARGRLGGEQLETVRRGRSESLGGNEALLMSKTREHERPRTSKWVPDDRESWKAKERWANGPDSSKRWLEVQTTGRQKQGWGTGDPLSRSQGDRWNTEGGRWTEERKQIDEKEYVPKNARWNDEERAERWRTSGGRGGEGAIRGRGPHARGQGSRRGHSDVQSLTELNGLQLEEFAGRKRDPMDRRARYNKKQLLAIYDKLQIKMGQILPLPKGVDVSYQGLFRDDSRLHSPEEEKIPEKPVEPAPKATPTMFPSPVMGISEDELEADAWVYKDPEGRVQGPFTKAEVLAWWEDGYFPDTLPVQSQLSAKENWVPLEKLLKLWNVVRTDNKRTTVESMSDVNSASRKLEACDSLATVGSHISSSLLPEMSSENLDGFQMSQPPIETPSLLQTIAARQHQAQSQHQQQAAFQNPPSEWHQTMQNLVLQRQKQSQQQQQQQQQQAGNVGRLNFANTSLGATGLTGLHPGMSFQQNNPFAGSFGLQQQQQQRPAGLQDNTLLTPGILEMLQQRMNTPQQTMNRPQMQASPYGFDLNSGLGNPLQSQLQGNPNLQNQLQANPNLAALLGQNQMAQRPADPRNAMSSELQRLLQARNMQAQQAQGNAYGGGLNNTLSSGMFGAGIRTPYMQQQQQQAPQQNPWNAQGQVPGGYNALTSLLQQQQRPQQINPQQQMAQAVLLSRLQGMRVPNQQIGMNHPALANRDPYLSLSAMQSGESPLVDAMLQNRQRNNMSPPNNAFQTSVGSSFPTQDPFAAGSRMQFEQQKPKTMTDDALSAGYPLEMGTLSLDSPPAPTSIAFPEDLSKTAAMAEQRAKTNAWGVAPPQSATASLLEIQEQESRSAQQTAASKEKQVQVPATGGMPVGGWSNVQRVKPTSLTDIMQEDAESQRQAQASAQAKKQSVPPNANPKQGAVWSKKSTGRSNSQSAAGGESGKGNTLMSKERSAKEEQDEGGGFWNLDSNGPTDASRDFSHEIPIESEVHLFPGQLKISQQFREWCKATMSRSEIAEYIQEYFREAPPDKLSVFISEFLKRKDTDTTQIKKERGGQKSKKQESSKLKDATKSSTNTVELDAISSGASESHGLEATGSGKATTTRTRDAKPKPKAKKQAKGQHIPADMLGFKSNVNFDSLYRGNSNG